jgi:5-formyltetrahydrofolate cyclo-ligase
MFTEVKKELRRRVRAAIKSMSDSDKAAQSTVLCNAALSIIDKLSAKNDKQTVIALFAPLPDEPNVAPLIDELYKICKIVLPRINGETMEFFPYSPLAMKSGAYGINEPQGETPVFPSEIDIMFVPGVAFTQQGSRMGRGKGYYDRYMSQKEFNAYKIGVCYLQQMVEELPLEEHDIPMDEILCNKVNSI